MGRALFVVGLILAIIVACFVTNAQNSGTSKNYEAAAAATAYAENMIPISTAEISGYVQTKEASTDSHGVKHPYGVYLSSGSSSATFHLHNIAKLDGNTGSLKVMQAYGDAPGVVTIQVNRNPSIVWQTNSEVFIELQEGDDTIVLYQPEPCNPQNCVYIAGIALL